MKSSNNSEHRFIKALYREAVDRTPVWIMRQAGRYLPEYRETRQQAGSFLNLCKNPTLACEVTLQPLRRYPELDAAILFSDILTIPDAMGLGLKFSEGHGPSFSHPIAHPNDIKNLKVPQTKQDLNYVISTVKLIKDKLQNNKPLIGFSGSPWTLASYMVEGQGKTDFSKIKTLLYNNPQDLHLLLHKLSEAVIDYLNEQIQHGVDAVQIFDTWGGILTTSTYYEFSLQYMQKIIAGLPKTFNQQKIPVIVFTKGGGLWLEKIAEIGANAVGIDWQTDIAQAKQRIGNKVAIQGNLDPAILLSNDTVIQKECQRTLENFQADGNNLGHIFNLGHGITPNIKPEKVKVLLDTIANFNC